MIYAMGNSHANFFSNSHPGVIGWGDHTRYPELGWKGTRNEYFMSYSANFHNPEYRHVLAHKFVERHFPYIINAINQVPMTKKDYIMFIVGEIDCRWHFPKKIKTQNCTVDGVLTEEMEYFFPAFLYLKENGYNIVGWGGHPSTTKGHNNDPDNPIYGDCLLRNEISLKWNDLLKDRCQQNDIKFISIIRNLINPGGFTKMEYFWDDYHLKPSVLPIVIEKCKAEGIIC